MSEGNVRTIEAICSPELSLIGYKKVTETPSRRLFGPTLVILMLGDYAKEAIHVFRKRGLVRGTARLMSKFPDALLIVLLDSEIGFCSESLDEITLVAPY